MKDIAMTAACKTKPSKNPASKPKLEVVTSTTPAPKTKNPRRRRKHGRRKKNKGMSTGAKIAIGAGIVLVGIPLVIFTVAAIGVAAVAKKGLDDMNKIVVDATPSDLSRGLTTTIESGYRKKGWAMFYREKPDGDSVIAYQVHGFLNGQERELVGQDVFDTPTEAIKGAQDWIEWMVVTGKA